MEGIQAIQTRILEIQQRMRSLAPPTAPPVQSGASTSTSTNTNFNSALESALQEFRPPSTSTNPTGLATTSPALSQTGLATTLPALSGPGLAPGALGQYGNGRIPLNALTPIDPHGNKLAGPAAQSFRAMATEATLAGVKLEVNDSYRSYDEQVDVAKRKGLYSQGGLAAAPGTSTHGLGMSVDIELDAKSRSWMQANGGRFGFVADVKGEPWHWTYKR